MPSVCIASHAADRPLQCDVPVEAPLRRDEAGFVADLTAEVGEAPGWQVGSFSDAAADVRASIDRLRSSPFIRDDAEISGHVYDVATGELEPVD